MTTTRQMFDDVNLALVPAGWAGLLGVYVDGKYKNDTAARAKFPHAHLVTITVFGHADADVIDRETGDATAAQAAAWARGQLAKGKHPTIYCNASSWPQVKAEVQKAGIAGRVSYWIADYDDDPTIPAGAVAKQFTDHANGRSLDGSVVAAHWPGVDPDVAPAPHLTVKAENRGYATLHWTGTPGATSYDFYQDGELVAIHTAGTHTTGKLHGRHTFRVLALGPGIRVWSNAVTIPFP